MKTREVLDLPAGYLTIEDKILMISRLQELEIDRGNAHLTGYPAPEYNKLINALLTASIMEVKSWSTM